MTSSKKQMETEELVTENDGHVRSAVVRTSTEHTKRPIVQLYPIEVDGKTDFVLTNDSINHVNFIRKRSIKTSVLPSDPNLAKHTTFPLETSVLPSDPDSAKPTTFTLETSLLPSDTDIAKYTTFTQETSVIPSDHRPSQTHTLQHKRRTCLNQTIDAIKTTFNSRDEQAISYHPTTYTTQPNLKPYTSETSILLLYHGLIQSNDIQN
ncbi:unnamed protein product [Mytilus coruscus]|uniref:Uncharacterized protein n=1 Tax=Mytilus coruscus TaxID=42192 RepID=A0A6J8DBT5_MYTCO|nr:unnamed protein product [Mytilus coruscus]